jgi:hypothetical protein
VGSNPTFPTKRTPDFIGRFLFSLRGAVVTRPANTVAAAGYFLRGAITAGEFFDILIMFCGPGELGLLLAGAGTTIAGIILAIICGIATGD